MSVTINAHQLRLLIDKTAPHAGPDSIESLHGIRLDSDATHLYAVASDRYTLAAARYRLNHDDQTQEPFAATLPAGHLDTVRGWLGTMKGAETVTITLTGNRLLLDGPQAGLAITTNPGLEFPNWRGLLRGIAQQTADDTADTPFPAFQSVNLGRWADTGTLRVRVTANQQAALLFGEDFIGAMMPSRYAALGPIGTETIDNARNTWKTVLDGSDTADMATDMPAEDNNHPRYEATKDVRETGEGLLRGVLLSTGDAFNADCFEDRDAFDAHIRAGVANWMAYRYLDALYNVDPRTAQAVVTDTAEQLDSGEIGEFAWDAAEEAGYRPKEWDEERETALRERNTGKPPVWAERLANSLNAARQAGIGFRVEDNPHVTYNADTSEWTAAKPDTAPAPATS